MHLWVSHRTNIRSFTHPAVQVSAPEALFYAAKMQEASFHSAVLTAAAFDEVRRETSRAALGSATKIYFGALPFTRAAVPRRRGGSAPFRGACMNRIYIAHMNRMPSLVISTARPTAEGVQLSCALHHVLYACI